MTAWGPRAAHQVRLLARSTRHLVRSPSDARELPRLLASGARSTMRLRSPWLPYRVIDELATHVSAGSHVLEFGGGGSTLWFLDRGASVVTVEDHPAWAARLAQAVGDHPSWELRQRQTHGGAYVSAADDLPDGSQDVVLVDGKERPGCIRASAGKVRAGGLLVVDDTDRAEYRSALQSIPWPSVEVVGFAPAKPSLGHCTIFTRP